MSDDQSFEDDAAADTSDEFDDDVAISPSKNWIFPLIAGLVVVGFGVAAFFILTSSSSKADGPEGVPMQNVPDLASPDSTVNGTPVNGITCRSSMGQDVVYHIHAHVNIFVNGDQKRIPAGVGITNPRWAQKIEGETFLNNSAKSCVYWLHSHVNDGIIHIESPTKKIFTLGDFFDIWDQPLSATQVGPAKGPVVAVVDGKKVTGSPRDIKLTEGAVIQLSVGEPVVPFKDMDFTVQNVCGDGTLTCSVDQKSSTS